MTIKFLHLPCSLPYARALSAHFSQALGAIRVNKIKTLKILFFFLYLVPWHEHETHNKRKAHQTLKCRLKFIISIAFSHYHGPFFRVCWKALLILIIHRTIKFKTITLKSSLYSFAYQYFSIFCLSYVTKNKD